MASAERPGWRQGWRQGWHRGEAALLIRHWRGTAATYPALWLLARHILFPEPMAPVAEDPAA